VTYIIPTASAADRDGCPAPTFFFFFFFFFQALNFLVESFGLLNDLFPFLSILDAGYPVFDLHLADVLFNVILPSILGSSL
jgi:hypothetical protein